MSMFHYKRQINHETSILRQIDYNSMYLII